MATLGCLIFSGIIQFFNKQTGSYPFFRTIFSFSVFILYLYSLLLRKHAVPFVFLFLFVLLFLFYRNFFLLASGCTGQPGKCHSAYKGQQNNHHHNSFHKLKFCTYKLRNSLMGTLFFIWVAVAQDNICRIMAVMLNWSFNTLPTHEKKFNPTSFPDLIH